jgi:RNA polymerase sigma-70 factor (ECF subfamily)
MVHVDAAALGQWFGAYAARLELYARQWLAPMEAADAVQEVFLRLAAQKSQPQDVAAWLFAALRNRAISQARSTARRRNREQRVAGQKDEWFAEDPATAIDAATARRLLSELPAEQREVVLLKIWGGLSFRQIVEIVDRPLTSIRREYLAALDVMRERMGESCPKKMD